MAWSGDNTWGWWQNSRDTRWDWRDVSERSRSPIGGSWQAAESISERSWPVDDDRRRTNASGRSRSPVERLGWQRAGQREDVSQRGDSKRSLPPWHDPVFESRPLVGPWRKNESNAPRPPPPPPGLHAAHGVASAASASDRTPPLLPPCPKYGRNTVMPVAASANASHAWHEAVVTDRESRRDMSSSSSALRTSPPPPRVPPHKFQRGAPASSPQASASIAVPVVELTTESEACQMEEAQETRGDAASSGDDKDPVDVKDVAPAMQNEAGEAQKKKKSKLPEYDPNVGPLRQFEVPADSEYVSTVRAATKSFSELRAAGLESGQPYQHAWAALVSTAAKDEHVGPEGQQLLEEHSKELTMDMEAALAKSLAVCCIKTKMKNGLRLYVVVDQRLAPMFDHIAKGILGAGGSEKNLPQDPPAKKSEAMDPEKLAAFITRKVTISSDSKYALAARQATRRHHDLTQASQADADAPAGKKKGGRPNEFGKAYLWLWNALVRLASEDSAIDDDRRELLKEHCLEDDECSMNAVLAERVKVCRMSNNHFQRGNSDLMLCVSDDMHEVLDCVMRCLFASGGIEKFNFVNEKLGKIPMVAQRSVLIRASSAYAEAVVKSGKQFNEASSNAKKKYGRGFYTLRGPHHWLWLALVRCAMIDPALDSEQRDALFDHDKRFLDPQNLGDLIGTCKAKKSTPGEPIRWQISVRKDLEHLRMHIIKGICADGGEDRTSNSTKA